MNKDQLFNKLKTLLGRIVITVLMIYDIRCLFCRCLYCSTMRWEWEVNLMIYSACAIAIMSVSVSTWIFPLHPKKFKRIFITNLSIIACLFLYYNTPFCLEQFCWNRVHGDNALPDFIDFGDNHYRLDWPYIYNLSGEKMGLIMGCYQDELYIKSLCPNDEGRVVEYYPKFTVDAD